MGAKVQRQMRGGAERNIECGANRFSWLVTVAENRFNRAPLSNYHWPFPIFPHTEEGTLAAHTFSNSSINFSALPSLCIHHRLHKRQVKSTCTIHNWQDEGTNLHSQL